MTMKIVAPGCRYLGPSEEIVVEQVLLVDKVAFAHDIAYQRATHRVQIIKADVRAALLFIWTALLGAVSASVLLCKSALECLSGTTFYPFRFFRAMDFFVQILLITVLLWAALLEFRLQGLQNKQSADYCARERSTWAVVQCLLHTWQKTNAK